MMTGKFQNSSQPGYWGPVTATLDWCEANYQFSHFIAEMANTMSNIFTILLALHGARMMLQEKLPKRYVYGYIGVALIGIGSFAFHATLTFEAQLADELPMIYVVANACSFLYDSSPGFSVTSSPKGRILLASSIVFDILFTLSYWMYRNPVYHQVVFASLMFMIIGRVTYLLRWSEWSNRIPQSTKNSITRVFWTGIGLFLFGFFVWNVDNIFCPSLTGLKRTVGWPTAFFLEGHAWWHLLTSFNQDTLKACGSYLMSIGQSYLALCVKDSPRNYALGFSAGLIPYIRRVQKVKA
ncbi:alkaline phytoceramidase [Rickenella mellea]|uniref:Alkaline phytoceramidase n=1 Tax=Rickenella mellea TaxID=50990 RepID=A0A4Y7Q0X2_9AGAM|nr:alkaline phytoceramidase [Rickenella mellea]